MTNHLWLVVMLALCVPPVVVAAESPPPATPQVADVDRWITDLDAPEFAQRQAASQKLAASGTEIFPQLEKAAESGSREVASRAIDILKTHFENGDEDARTVAKETLERLSKCGNSAAAERANLALNPPERQSIPMITGNLRRLPIQLNNRQVQIQLGGNVGKRLHMSQRGGVREIESEENGRKVKITQQADGKIEMEITEKENGKDVTKKYEAKNADELKTKHPDAYKDFEPFKGPDGIRIGMDFPGAKEHSERIVKMLDDQIERLKPRAQENPAVQRMIENLQEQRDRYKKQSDR